MPKVDGRAVCRDCANRLKQEGGANVCKRSGHDIFSYLAAYFVYCIFRCHGAIDGTPLRWQGENFHPYHFNCTGCNVELTASAREVGSKF